MDLRLEIRNPDSLHAQRSTAFSKVAFFPDAEL